MPLQRRIPKRGFVNIFANPIVTVNVGSLEKKFENGAVVDNNALVEAGIIKKSGAAVKVLANGSLSKSLTVKVSAFSEAAKQKIETAGGKAEGDLIVYKQLRTPGPIPELRKKLLSPHF